MMPPRAGERNAFTYKDESLEGKANSIDFILAPQREERFEEKNFLESGF